jgi:hypothetical protein
VQRKTFLPPRGSQELAHAGMIAFAYEWAVPYLHGV